MDYMWDVREGLVGRVLVLFIEMKKIGKGLVQMGGSYKFNMGYIKFEVGFRYLKRDVRQVMVMLVWNLKERVFLELEI